MMEEVVIGPDGVTIISRPAEGIEQRVTYTHDGVTRYDTTITEEALAALSEGDEQFDAAVEALYLSSLPIGGDWKACCDAVELVAEALAEKPSPTLASPVLIRALETAMSESGDGGVFISYAGKCRHSVTAEEVAELRSALTAIVSKGGE